MSSPDISVIMCVRNGASLIAEALDSVQAQQVERLETLVVDDGSSDGTVEIARRHPLNPTLIRQEHKGVAAGRNAAVDRASGELLCFIDYDDVWPEGRLSAMREALRQDSSLDAVFGQVVNTDERLRPIAPPVSSRFMTAMLTRRALFTKVGPFRTDLSHATAVDWISRAVTGGLRSRCLDRIVLWRRIHGKNMGITGRAKGRRDMLQVIRDHHNRARRG
jgi:glycosyltransferase involved in cell wall biosynthesis